MIAADIESLAVDDDSHGAPVTRTTSAGVHPYSSPAASSAAVNTSPQASAPNSKEDIKPEDVPRVLPPPKKPLWKRKWFIITQIILACIGIAMIFILLYPVVHAIAQHIVNVSVLHIDSVQITNPTNTSFTLKLDSWVSHAGIFSASLHFTQPIALAWYNASGARVPIGSFPLTNLHVHHKRAYINQTMEFTIVDQDAFTQFTRAMITQQNFTWHLTSRLDIQADKFPKAHGLHFRKDITINGMNSFAGAVKLLDFQMPGDDPAGNGITFVTTTGLDNASPFNVDLGTAAFDLVYKGVYLGTGSGPNTIVRPGANNVTLTGTLVPQSGAANLSTVSELFTNFLNGDVSDVVAVGRSSIQSDGSIVQWLSEGLEALQLHVPFVGPGAVSPITAIDIGNMQLAFTPQAAWAPIMDTRTVQASMVLPFGFGLSITEIANSFNITTEDGAIVGGLSTPEGASTSDVHVVNSSLTQGTINITIAHTPLEIPDASHDVFSVFNRNLTDSTQLPFRLVGHARTVANMSIGAITLDPIKFDVPSGLQGLQGLQGKVDIGDIDVVGGSLGAIHLSIPVNITNPSNLVLGMGDLDLQLFRGADVIGTTLLPNVTLQMGVNQLLAQGNFTPNVSPGGVQTLNDFVGGSDVRIAITGYQNSTAVPSLLAAIQSLNISAALPALRSQLLKSAALEVLPTTGRTNNVAHTTVSLANPFSAGLVVTSVRSTVAFRGITLGTIDQAVDGFNAGGRETVVSPALALGMNVDPSSLFTVTRVLAEEAGMQTAQLDAIVQLGGYQYVGNVSAVKGEVERRDNLFTGFDMPSYVDKAFAQLAADVHLESGLTIGEYETTLTYTQPDVKVTTDKSLNLLLPLLAQPIVQKIVGGSVLAIDTVLIKDMKEGSFGTSLKGNITNAGPFDAKIAFPEGLIVEWNGKPLGNMNMPTLDVVGGVGASFEVDATFAVADVDHLTNFTKVMLTEESFEWVISGNNLSVAAIGLNTDGVSMTDKRVTLKGMNSLKGGVTIEQFDLPSDDPKGGVRLVLNTTVVNPSQVGVALDSIAFQNFFGGVNIGGAASAGAFNLAPLSTVPLALSGSLIPQSDSGALATVSQMFNNFIHGKDSNITVQGDSAGPTDVTWLNEGIKALIIQTVLPNQGTLDIIKSVSLNELDLRFTEENAFAPAMGSDDTIAKFALPFSFPVNIVAVAQNLTIGADGTDFAELVIPKGPSTTEVEARVIHLQFAGVPFAARDDQHAAFEQFLATTETQGQATMSLKGIADTDAETAIGRLAFTGIAFDVQTTIGGLAGLDAKPAEVTSLDVNHGFADYLLIKVTSSLYNPSNITLGSGDVAFDLQFDGATIGKADLTDLVILPGNKTYPIDVHYQPQGRAVASGQKMLENYLQGVMSATAILGSTDATPIESLQLALSQIHLSPVNIPPLHQNLILTASLVFPTNIAQTGLAQTSFTLANPFTAALNLFEVTATATFGNLTLGKIDHVSSSTPIHADGHANISSPTLPFEFNLDPVMIIELLFAGAKNNDVDLGPLPDVFEIVLADPGAQTGVNATVDTGNPPCVSGKQFDAAGAILAALKDLEVELGIETSVKIDDYATDLAFSQHNVRAITDETALYLIGVVAPPIVQKLVDQSTLVFNVANITNIAEDGFDLSLKGSLTGTGPFDAQITFVEPVTVTWEGSDIAQIALPPVCAAAVEGTPDYETHARLTITDAGRFTDFATALLHTESFTWTISTDQLRLTALGEHFDGVSLRKDVSFKAFNGLPGVSIQNFRLPADDPAGGIHIETDSVIPSPAQLGIDLGTVAFESAFKGVTLGPLTGEHLVLAPNAESGLHLSGRITPKTGEDVDTVGVLFTNYLQAENQTLAVRGQSVQPTGAEAPVRWLSTAFKTLVLEVTLPGQRFEIIQSIDMADLEIGLTEQGETFAPRASSRYVLAEYKNPFGFSLQVVKSAQHITLGTGGVDVAKLELPQEDVEGGVSTGNVVPLVLPFQNQTLQSVNDAAFPLFFAAVTDTAGVSFELKGTADVVARTAVGDVPIDAIAFDVTTSLKGINSFGHTASLSNVSITGSGTDSHGAYVKSPLTTKLNNPSNISLDTVDVALPVYYQNVMIGRAVLDPLNLVPGDNELATEFRYAPQDANDTTAQAFLTEFLQTSDDIALAIKGDGDSSPFATLVPGLEGVSIATSLKGLAVPPIVTHINAYITLATLVDNYITIDFDIANPLDTPMEITFAQVDSGVNNATYAHFDQAFAKGSFVIPAHGSANSGAVPNVLLTQGAIASLGIIPLGRLDVFSIATVRIGEYTIPWLHLTTRDVETEYHLELSIAQMKQAAQAVSASSASRAGHALASTAAAAAASSASGSSDVASASADAGGGGGKTLSAVSSGAQSLSAQPESSAAGVSSAVSTATPTPAVSEDGPKASSASAVSAPSSPSA